MGQTLYWDCGSGISGDMMVGSLLDLGADENKLRQVLSGIADDGFTIRISRVVKSGIDCCDYDVVLDAAHENHDHDMEYLYGHEMHEHADEVQEHEHSHDHAAADPCEPDDQEEHVHHHEGHNASHDHSHAHHEHRNLADVIAIISALTMTDRAREIAIRTFTILAEAESKAHGLPVDQIHFHEVGAIDSIADIVAAAVCLDDLDITEVIVPSLTDGTGTVRCQHGIIPVPVPAVLNIATAHHLPLRITDRRGEYVTPTGAAFVAAVITQRHLPETFIPVRVGLGAGKRAYETPGMLRAILIETA